MVGVEAKAGLLTSLYKNQDTFNLSLYKLNKIL